MHNKWITYGFLSLMGIALVTLAVLQYKWLGSVSDAEKERLEESLAASSENFVAEFNRNFSEVQGAFRIQITDREIGLEEPIGVAWNKWLRTSVHTDLVDSVYLIREFGSQTPSVFVYEPDPGMLQDIIPDHEIRSWIEKQSSDKMANVRRVSLHSRPDFGEQSFISVPVQLIDMVRVRNADSNKNIEVRMSLDHSDDMILIKLDDDFIKQEMIPGIARTYFTESFDDQYQLSIVDNKENSYVYYTSDSSGEVKHPDFSSNLDQFNFSTVLMLGEDDISRRRAFPDSAKAISFSFGSKVTDTALDTNVSSEGRWESHFMSENISSIEINNLSRTSSPPDSLVTSSVAGMLAPSTWQLWLSFKQGSLDAFVNQTRNRNLAISFGILGILGISVVMIVMYSQRSRDLAEQQMLFVAGVSHELRTPLAVIRSAAENLSEGVVQDENRKKEYAGLMLKEGRRLSDMVDQIMEFSGIQTGKRVYNFTSVNIEEFLESVKLECKHLLEDRGMNLEYSVNTKTKQVQADPDALFLSVSNLISNAIKFSGDSKKVFLKLDDVSFKGKDALRIQVQDFGIGIPEGEQKEIFKPFFRGKKPVDEQVKGNGIGLSLVQKVAVAHRGEISVKSKESEGSVFSFVIPIDGAHGA